MKYKIREQLISLVLLLALTGWIGLAFYRVGPASVKTAGHAAQAGGTLVIDAGHGGEDGGAVSPHGTVESHINLAIALRMDAILGLFGAKTILLRSEDISLHDPDCDTIREKKVSDLHNRVAMIQGIPDATVISIHQNMFTQPQYHGAQVFYRDAETSKPLATILRENLRAQIDSENDRELKKVPETVYIMNRIECPAVIVECGFLSNPMEETRLRAPSYQTKLAAAIAGSWLEYIQVINEEGATPYATQS